MSEQPRDNRVLERNLGLLLRRAYVPALPRPEFRDGVLARARREAERLARGRAVEHVLETPARRWQHLAAAAAVLLAVLAGFLALNADFRSPEARLTDAGAVALGFTGTWRAASADELSAGLDLADGTILEDAVLVATPEGAAFTVHTPAASLRVEPASLVRLDVVPRGTRIHVRRGSAHRIATGSTGATTEDLPLEEGTLTILRPVRSAGVAVTEDTAPPRAGTDTRRPAAGNETTGEEAPREAREAPPGTLALRVSDGAGGDELDRFDLLLLLDNDDPEPEEPDVLPFGAGPDEADARLDGRHVTPVLSPGRYRVFVQAEGFALYRGPTLDLGGATPAPELRVELVRGGSVRGWIVDGATGNPIPGAWVLSETDAPTTALPFQLDGWRTPAPPAWMRASTVGGSDGRFTLEHLSPGPHVLRITRPGYGPTWVSGVEVADGGVRGDVDVVLEPGGSITGTVTAEDGSPLHGAFLIVMPVAMTATSRPLSFSIEETDAAGTYRFGDLPSGMVMVLKWDSGEAAQGGVQPVLRPATVVPPRESRVDFLGHRAGVRLEGVFRDRAGRPLPGEKLSVLPRDSVEDADALDFQATATDAQGRFALLLPEPGGYLIYRTFGMGERLSLCEELEVPDVRLHETDVRAWGGTLRGTLRAAGSDAADSGAVLSDGFVIVERLAPDGARLMAGRAFTGADGSWALPGLRGGRYVVHAGSTSGTHGPVRAEEVELVEALPGESLPEGRVDLELPPAGQVRLVLEDPAGTRRTIADIDAFDADGQDLILGTDPVPQPDGAALLRGLPPGDVRLRARASGAGGTGETTVRVVPGRTLEATIRITEPDNR